MAEIETAPDEHIEKAKVQWVIPQSLNAMTFVGHDVLAVAHDIYIVFLNLRTQTEMVYVANNEKVGDGVDVIAGHRANIFAFAEKVQQPRIFIISYPSLLNLAEMKDPEVQRYKGLCMMESDLVAGFSGFPNYVVAVWNWRTSQKLLSLPTGVTRRNQIYMASRTHMLVCECWGAGLIVWEVAQCYKMTLMMRRAKEEVKGWEISEPHHVDVCWSSEGQLYAIDQNSNLYSVLSDGIKMVTNLEWSEDLKGDNKPCICSFGNGLLIYGPDGKLRSLKKCETKWKVVWTHEPPDAVRRLVGSAAGDVAAAWTELGMVYRLVGESEENIEVEMVTFKQRNIQKVQLIAPDYTHLATINNAGVICIYEVLTAKLVAMNYVKANDVSFEASPAEPLLAVFGETGPNYGVALLAHGERGLQPVHRACLTHQIVSLVAFAPSGRQLVAAAMAAGHLFIMQLTEDNKLEMVRYLEVGRGLADCFLMKVGEAMRCFALVLFSDKYLIGERIICVNAETGKDNKFTGKMMGPYARLLPLGAKDCMVGVPHLARHYHVLQLAGDKGATVSVKMGPIVESGHDVKSFDAFYCAGALLTFGYDGTLVVREPDGREAYESKLVVSHRYETGIRQAVIDTEKTCLVHRAGNGSVAVLLLRARGGAGLQPPDPGLFDSDRHAIRITARDEKNYLDIIEEQKVHEEAMDYRKQREEVVAAFEAARAQLVALLEENIAERPLHQLSLSEFNLHVEHKKERLKQAEQERLEIRLATEARIRAQDAVTAWIKSYCWDTMLTPRVKLFAIFSHYQVENYAVLPTQRENWPELQQVEALRALEMQRDADLFRPWEEAEETPEPSLTLVTRDEAASTVSVAAARRSAGSAGSARSGSGSALGAPHALAGSAAHQFVRVPPFMIPQTLAFSFLQMNWLQHIVKLNAQNMRLWFNKQFDELMNMKKREVNLVCERNARLRFIIEELNKLSDLRGSFHHLIIPITDPEWRQEEQPQKLIKVDPEECSVAPYVSPSQVAVAAPEGGPKDDFRERALVEMMDGVLEKLWHEEIKKPIPMPQCMLEKDPERFNEDDLRAVFEYEARVALRSEERDRYRKMLHAEHAKLGQVLNEGVVKFNQKVKEMWLMKLKVDSVIGQENLNLMRLRRTNLDRVEMAEKLEVMREEIAKYEQEESALADELRRIQQQAEEAQAALDALAQRDKLMDRTFKNHFADLSPIIVDQCYKYFKKRPKWHVRASMTPAVLHALAGAVAAGARPALLHPDCVDFFKGVEQLDLVSNMPPVMDEGLWATMVRLRRAKIENEIRMRGVAQEIAYVESAHNVWTKAIAARRNCLARTADLIVQHREAVELMARNRTIQLVLPAGQVELPTSGRVEDFQDAALIPREHIDSINQTILRVGEAKLRMMRRQTELRAGVLAMEWRHAQTRMKLAHMQDELRSYTRLKIPKELQLYLKNKEQGYTDEQDYVRLEKEMEASKRAVNKMLAEQMHRAEELELKIAATEAKSSQLEKQLAALTVQVSERRLAHDPLEPIRVRRALNKRMEMLVQRAALVREVQANHSAAAQLHTELELLRLRTYPTLAAFRTLT